MAKIEERHRKAAKDAVYDYMVKNDISYDWNQKHARDCYAQGMADVSMLPEGYTIHKCTPDTTPNVHDWGKCMWTGPGDGEDGYGDTYAEAVKAAWESSVNAKAIAEIVAWLRDNYPNGCPIHGTDCGEGYSDATVCTIADAIERGDYKGHT